VNSELRFSNYSLDFTEPIATRIDFFKRAARPKPASEYSEENRPKYWLIIVGEGTVYENAAAVWRIGHSYSRPNARAQSAAVVEDFAGDASTSSLWWGTAPPGRRSFLAILALAVFFFATDFSLRISVAVQARRFFAFFAILASALRAAACMYARTGKGQFITLPSISQ
jgi:hypothetical protein